VCEASNLAVIIWLHNHGMDECSFKLSS